MATTLVGLMVYFGFLIIVGMVSSRKMKSASDFIVAGRGIGFFTFVLLMLGSTASGGTTLGVPGLGFVGGWPTFWEQFFLPLSCCVCLILFGVKLNRIAIKRDYLTLEDYFCERYYSEKAMRILSPAISIIICLVYLIAQYRAIGIVLDELLKDNILLFLDRYHSSTLADFRDFLATDNNFIIVALIISAAVILVYVLFGGLQSIAIVTVFHVMLILIGIIVITPFVVYTVPDFNQVLQNTDSNMVKPFYPQMHPPYETYAKFTPVYILSFGLFLVLGIASAPHVINNVFAVKDAKYFRWAPLLVFVIFFVVMSLFKINGFAARALAEQGRISVSHPDYSLIVAIKYALPQYLWVFMGIVILAAVISTTDRLMLTIGNCVSWSIYKKFLRKNADDEKIKMMNRCTIVVATTIAVALAIEQIELLVFLIWISIGIMFSTFTVPLVGGLYWKKATKEAAIVSMVMGLVSAVVFALVDRYLKPLPVHFSLLSFLVSASSFIIMSYLTRPPSVKVLENTETGLYIWRP